MSPGMATGSNATLRSIPLRSTSPPKVGRPFDRTQVRPRPPGPGGGPACPERSRRERLRTGRRDGPIRLVCVDHLATQECGRGLYRTLARSGEVELTLVIPPLWRDNFRDIPADRPLAPADGDRGLGRASSDLFAVTILPILFPGKSNRCIHPGLGRLLRNIRPDAVFVQAEPEDFLLSQLLLLRAVHRLNFRLIFITWRNIPYPRFGIPYKFAWVYACTEFLGLRGADHCFAFNAAGRETLNARGFHAIDVIPPAIDTSFFQPTDGRAVRDALGLKHFSIGFFGRFVSEKGGELLLDAMAGLDHPTQLLLVGNGPAREAWLEKARQLKIADRVIHKPSILRSEVPAHLCACDVVVLPSYATRTWKEQFGRVLVEAMACGVPVIGSDSGEIPRVIGDAGLIFPEKSGPGLRDCLKRIIEDPALRRRLIALGRARAEREYSCAAVAAAWLRAIRNLLARPRPTRAGGRQEASPPTAQAGRGRRASPPAGGLRSASSGGRP